MKKILIILLVVITLIIGVILSINYYVIYSVKDNIINLDDIKDYEYDAIVVLGTSVIGDEPGPVLEERILHSVDLYNAKVSDKILMSGDSSTEYYDEVNVMKDFAIEKGVLEEDIVLDYNGLSTYESIYNLKELFNYDKILIVTQEFHIYRALFIAESLDIDADTVIFYSEDELSLTRNVREILARNKDFVLSIFKPKPETIEDYLPNA